MKLNDAPITPREAWCTTAIVQLDTGLIVCMPLTEGLALFGIFIYFIDGPWWLALASVAVSWGAFAVAWPRRGWYGLR